MRRYTFGLAAVTILVALASFAPAAFGGAANAGLPGAGDNPVANVQWGTYQTTSTDPSLDPPSAYYNTAHSDADKAEFAKLLAVPRFRWFGAWVPTYDQGNLWGAYKTATRYIAAVQNGNPDVAVGIGIFRLDPFEHAACKKLPTAAQVADYKAWIQEFARGIGDSRVIILLQPDMPFTICLPHHSRIDLQLIKWTIQQFGALSHTTIYLDSGASDWLSPLQSAAILRAAGVAGARGFALGLTHFDSTANELAYGDKIVALLKKMGVPNMHFAINTSMNGRPFTTHQYWHEFMAGTVCATLQSLHCVTLGQPPTTDTGDPLCDAFLWFGRPWINDAVRRSYDEVLRLVTTSPFFQS